MVFQSLALFPHLSVAGNVGYGLRIRGASKEQIATTVEELLKLVSLSGMGGRRIQQLSGGQRQRVATARALALAPAVPAGRAAVGARREPPRAAAGRAAAAAAAARDHDDHRARPARGDDDVRPRGRDERGADRAGRAAARRLPPAGLAVRRRLHRAHEPAARRGDRRRLDRRRRPPVRRRGRGDAVGPVTISVRPESAQLHTDGAGERNTLPGSCSSATSASCSSASSTAASRST